MGILILAAVAIVLLVIAISLTHFVFSLLLLLLVAGAIGWAADRLIPGALPGGWGGAILTGIIGAFVGTLLFSMLRVGLGPQIQGIHLIPAFVGAVLVAVVAQLVTSRRQVQRA